MTDEKTNEIADTVDEIAESREQTAETTDETADSREQIAETTDETAEAVTTETAGQTVEEPAVESVADVSPTEAEAPITETADSREPTADSSVSFDPAEDQSSGQAKELAEAGILARLKMKLKDMLIAARRKKQEKMAANLETIMAYSREHGKITNNEVETLVKVKDRQATRYLAGLAKQGRLMRFGTKRNIFYKPVE